MCETHCALLALLARNTICSLRFCLLFLLAHTDSVDKATFKLVYHTGTDFQSQRFETDTKTAEDVVKKLKYVMLMRSSAVRDDYTALKEQKLQRKFSSHHLPSFI